MGWITRAWRGEERLWKVFWIYGLILGIGIGIVAVVIKSIFGTMAYALFWIPRVIYMIWLMVAQWRCAFNVEWTIWGYVVRVLVIISLLAIPGALIGGVMVGQDLIKAAECRKELKEYVAKGGTDVEGFKKQCIARQQQKDANSTSDSSRNPSHPGIMDAVKAGIDCSREAQAYQKSGGTDVKEFEHKCIQQRLHGDAAQPSNGAPTLPPVNAAPESPQDKFKQLCEKTMTDYAQKAGSDPQQYIAQNQAYLQQCVQYYVSQDAASNKK